MALHYNFICFKSKGIIVLLLWSFSAAYLFHKSVLELKNVMSPKYAMVVTAGIICYPILGWLADARYGRYRVVKYSLSSMWALSIINCLLQVIVQLFNIETNPGSKCAFYVINGLIIIAIGGVQANIVQFGIDQISDAPSEEIASFIRWYGWVYFWGQGAAAYTVLCFNTKNCSVKESYVSLYALIEPTLLSLMLVLDFSCSSWLKTESEYKNPFRVIFKVLRYACKNHYPKLRSSFSYWDKKHSSRLDLAKSRFGGPFTSDEVESVKAFFRMVLLLTIASIFVSMVVFIDVVADKMIVHLSDNSSSNTKPCNVSVCFWRVFVSNFGIKMIIVAFPLSEIIIRPWINKWKYFQRLSLTSKFVIGMFFLFIAVVIYGSLDEIGHVLPDNLHKNACVLSISQDYYHYDNDSLPLPFKWLILPSIIYYIGNYIMVVTGGQFISAQSPSFMKGLLFGLIYGSIGLGILINYSWLHSIQNRMIQHLPSASPISCGTAYFITLAGFLLVTIVLFSIAIKCYKKTRRGFDDSIETSFVAYDSSFY